MEPQNQVPPTSQPPVVVDAAPQPPMPEPVLPQQKNGRGRKWLLAVVVIVIAILVGLGVWLATKHTGKPTQHNDHQLLGQQPTNPDYGNIKVGDFRYVNACQALSAADENQLFAGLAQSADFSATSAEHTLSNEAIAAGSGKVSSSCYREFGSNTSYADTVVTFSIDQYPTIQGAQKAWDALTVSQQDLDKANQRFGSNLTNDVAPLSGAANTVYDSSTNASYTRDSNKIISFSGLLVHVPADTFKQNIVGALPKVLAKVHDNTLSQQLNPDPIFGTKLGEATYYEPCKFFTADDFKAITGAPNNPTDIKTEYQYLATTDTFSDISDGAANNACTRNSFPGVAIGESVKLQMEYFKTTSDATQTIHDNFTRLSGESGEKLEPVSGLGTYAYYRTTTDGSDLSYFDVQQGPYILEFLINKGEHPVTLTDYTKAAHVMLPKLK